MEIEVVKNEVSSIAEIIIPACEGKVMLVWVVGQSEWTFSACDGMALKQEDIEILLEAFKQLNEEIK